MHNLIHLILLVLSTSLFSCGHHRGEQDIELDKNIINFLCEVKKYQNRILTDLTDAIPDYLEFKPVANILYSDEEELPLYNTPSETPCPFYINSIK